MSRDPLTVEELEQRLAAAPGPTERGPALAALAWALRAIAPGRAAQLATEAVTLLRPQQRPRELAGALRALAVGLRNGSDLAPAARAGQEAVALLAGLPPDQRDPTAEAQARVHHGITLTLLGRSGDALQQFEAARELSRNIGDAAGEADALMDTAVVANMMGDDAKAIALYRQVLPIYRQLQDDYHLATVLNNQAWARVCWGRRCAAEGRTDEAAAHFESAVADVEQALPLAERSGHADFVVSCLDTLSSALRELGQWPRLRDNLARQLAAARALEGRRMEAATLATLGEAERRSGRLDESIAALEAAEALCTQLQLSETLAPALDSLSRAYEAAGRLAEALAAHRRFHAAEIRMRSQAAEDRLNQLKASLQLERAEAELAAARQRQAELAALNARLVEAGRERDALMAELERHSNEDSLTELLNRRAFDRLLAVECERARRYGTPLSLALVDVDHFKQINDRCSHGVGDAVLRVVGRLLREHGRASDIAARLGGDEFVLLLPETRADGALALCRLLGQRVAGHDWAAIHEDARPTLSIGIAEFEPAAPRGDEALLARADVQLYRAKLEGRNRVCAEAVAAGAAQPVPSGTQTPPENER